MPWVTGAWPFLPILVCSVDQLRSDAAAVPGSARNTGPGEAIRLPVSNS